MSDAAAFCFALEGEPSALLLRLKQVWVKEYSERFAYLENAANPNENYSVELPPDPAVVEFASLVQKIAEPAVLEILQRFGAGGPLGSQSIPQQYGEAPGPGWICKIGSFSSLSGHLSDFVATVRVLREVSIGRLVYLRDSYSLSFDVWTRPLKQINLDAILEFQPDVNSREVFEIV